MHDELNRKATDIITSFGYIANQAHCAVEAKPPVHWNKGRFNDKNSQSLKDGRIQLIFMITVEDNLYIYLFLT